MKLLVTGGAGFIGSNFVSYMLEKYENIQLINLDKLTYAGSLENINEVLQDPRHIFIHGDICDRSLVERIFADYEIDGVIHFAAESHVDNSIINPATFVKTNVQGTLTLLEVARKYWLTNSKGKGRFHHISTDEVYGTLGADGYFTEDRPYAPNSPYSASKAAADMLVRSYFHTYGLDVVTTNCSNNYGPKQHDEKLIPTIIRKALALEPIPIYGNGQNVRDWLFVEDHCRAIEQVYLCGRSGESYLIGGHNEKRNIEIAHIICDCLDRLVPMEQTNQHAKKYRDLITFVDDRPGHDLRYAIDDTKLRSELDYRLHYSFEKGMDKTISYYLTEVLA